MESESHIKYLLASEQDVNWDLVITTVGYQNIDAHTKYPSSSHPVRYLFSTENGRVLNEYQLIYITRGSGRFVSSSHKIVRVEAGDIFLLFPGEWHNYSPDSETGWHESWIGFTGINMDEKCEKGFFQKTKPIFHIGICDDVFALFQKATQVAQEQKIGYQQVLSGIVNLLLGYTYSRSRLYNFTGKNKDFIVARAKVMMQDMYDSDISGEEIAEKLGVSYSSFRKSFKMYTGFAPNQYMLQIKMSKAKELLTNTDMACQQVGYAVGFETPSAFHIAFRNKVGMSPNSYREMTQGKLIESESKK